MDWKAGVCDGGWEIATSAGRISSLRRCPDAAGTGLLASPGLVQAHVHLCQTLFRGMAEDRPLMPWLSERIWPMEAAHTADTLATSVILSLMELLSSGCTCLLDMGSVRGTGVTLDILRRSGIRAVAGNALMDRGPAGLEADLAELREETRSLEDLYGGLVSRCYAPRFALSCSDALWRWLAGLPARVCRATHAAESPDELLDPGIRSDGGNIRYLLRRGFLGSRTLLAHCIHLQEGEAGILAASGASAVTCPWANLKLASGIADTQSLRDSGVRVLLGSDGAACNNRLDAAGDARLAMSLAALSSGHRPECGSAWLRSLTGDASEAMGLDNSGLISEGSPADLAVLRLHELDWEEIAGCADPIRFVLELDWPSRISRVLCAGEPVYDEGRFPTLPPLPMSPSEARAEVLRRSGMASD